MPASNMPACLPPHQSDAQSSANMHGTGVAAFKGYVWELSRDKDGCRKLQEFLEESTEDADKVTLLGELRTHVLEAMRCPNANHVLQEFIRKVPPNSLQFVIDELAEYGFVAVAKHKFGCRIAQRLLEQVSPTQLAALLKALLGAPVELSGHASAHFVMACLLERASDFESQYVAVTEALTEFVSSLPVGSKVHCSHQQGESLACVFKAALETSCGSLETEAMRDAKAALANALLLRTDVLTDLVSAYDKGFRHGPETVKLTVEVAQRTEKQLLEVEVAQRTEKQLMDLIEKTPETTRYGRELKKKLKNLQEQAPAGDVN